jgi:hypothetical protein
VKDQLKKQFYQPLSALEQQPSANLLIFSQMNIFTLISRVQELTGIWLTEQAMKQLEEDPAR